MPAAPTLRLRRCFSDPLLDVGVFLNDVVARFPTAISFAPGRPHDETLDVEAHLGALGAYVVDEAKRLERDPAQVWRMLGQYSRTNGIVAESIATHLRLDERIGVEPDAILVTVGAQEAMAILLAGLFERRRDILLVSEPTYIGITGLARMLGIRTVPVDTGAAGLDPDAVDRAIRRLSGRGRMRVRALYDIPDFNNPLGTTLPLAQRMALLDVCRRHEVLLIEDNAYGMFAYDGDRLPTLKSLDRSGDVIYVGSFSKTLFPGLRAGYLVADQRLPTGESLAGALARVKALTTVNTPPLMQAIVAAALRRTGGTLEPIVAPKRARYRLQRDAMLAALGDRFGSGEAGVSWNQPAGGFFLSVTLPFDFGRTELTRCVEDHGVIVSPMRFFCIGPGCRRQVRLAFSSADPETIARGIERFAGFVDRQPRAPIDTVNRDRRAPAGADDDDPGSTSFPGRLCA
jgi:(S)-3,5-dihydroxyphenylglycine transaminase